MLNVSDVVQSMSEREIGKLDLSSLSTAELRGIVEQMLELTAKNLFILKKAWLELENRGEDLTDLRRGIAVYLPLIGERLDASVVINFGGRPNLIKELSKFPIEEQKKLAETDKIQMVKIDRAGNPAVESVHVSDVPARDYYKVFDNGKIRPIIEQKKILKLESDARAPGAVITKKIIYNKHTGMLYFAGATILAEDVLKSICVETGASIDDVKNLLGIK